MSRRCQGLQESCLQKQVTDIEEQAQVWHLTTPKYRNEITIDSPETIGEMFIFDLAILVHFAQELQNHPSQRESTSPLLKSHISSSFSSIL